MKKRLGCSLFALFFLVFGSFWAVENVLPYSIIRPYKHASAKKPSDFGLRSEDVLVKGFGEIDLGGWLVLGEKKDTSATEKGEPKTMIFCHGISNNRGHMLEMAQKMARLGWNSLLLDGRAHGESGGDFCTFGFFEEKDMVCAVDFLETRFGKSQKIGIWGASLGGAIALQSLENDERLDLGIVESTFCDLPTIISDYQKRMFFGLRLPRASARALEKAAELAHFDPQKVRPVDAALEIEQPVFLAHGDADDRISVEYGKRIFENLKSSKKELFIVTGADHLNVHRVGGADFERRIEAFLAKNGDAQ